MKGTNVSKYFKDLKVLGEKIEEDKRFNEILQFCKVLGNNERLKIIQVLKKDDKCVCELETVLNKAQSTISHHLRKLEEIGLIRGWKKGKFTHYDVITEKLIYFLNQLDAGLKKNL